MEPSDPLGMADEEPTEKSDPTIVYDRERALDDARLAFANKLFKLLIFVLVGGVGAVLATNFKEITYTEAKDLFLTVFTAILAIVSSVVGYYFGRAEGARNG